MKRKFSTHWNSSTQPRKQRKYRANAPLHLKRKLLSVNLSKELRKKHNRRNIPAVKGDTVKIMTGKFKKKQGKIISIDTKTQKIKIEGITVKKRDGSKVNVKIHPSNLQITELNLNDKKRIKTMTKEKTNKEEKKTEEKSKESKK
jgi:large subunit ribosomal protein L24